MINLSLHQSDLIIIWDVHQWVKPHLQQILHSMLLKNYKIAVNLRLLFSLEMSPTLSARVISDKQNWLKDIRRGRISGDDHLINFLRLQKIAELLYDETRLLALPL